MAKCQNSWVILKNNNIQKSKHQKAIKLNFLSISRISLQQQQKKSHSIIHSCLVKHKIQLNLPRADE